MIWRYNTFTALIYKFLQKARVFVPRKPLQLGLMFIGKALD
jgi:hypothetical protein